MQHSNVKKNEKIRDLLKIQCCNTLKILTKLNQNDLNPNSRDCNFTRAKFDDQQKIAKLIEIDDALIDKTIHYFECAQNLKEKKNSAPNLIQVQMNVNQKQNNSRIFIKDFSKNNGPPFGGLKRKHPDSNTDSSQSSKRNFMFIAASNVKRPQIAYKIKVDNAYSTPFIPKLTKKPNAIVSLEESLKPLPQNELPSNLLTGYNYPKHCYRHPYQHEIENFTVPLEFFNKLEVELKPPSSIGEKQFKFINKRDDLCELIRELKNYKEIAIDLEHHSFRSYQGLTCLLQISTDDTDYIIDVFPLWNDMQMLNEIFTLPSILKVFHSSTFDIIWLQRDLGIYVVNMFDTWVAAKILDYQHLSLSSLVEHFCQFQMDKRFQLADWRIRPIPDEMLQYARCDTHFLLKLKQELLNASDETANLLRVAMERSQQMCLKRYEKKLPEINDHVHLI
ncbi:exosome component 10-like protein [Euroglyphus maynei]|uniref:Exosome component 10-like protein n=1 Tax=Euroglyphus maynei TaxID=6958 RepID=A0A1Y3BQS6_EURMA|nr:exosome component 10-like protein [Euroglyphus maynei]